MQPLKMTLAILEPLNIKLPYKPAILLKYS